MKDVPDNNNYDSDDFITASEVLDVNDTSQPMNRLILLGLTT